MWKSFGETLRPAVGTNKLINDINTNTLKGT